MVSSLCPVQTYTEKAPMPEPRTRFGAAFLAGKIWVVSGYDNVDGNGVSELSCNIVLLCFLPPLLHTLGCPFCFRQRSAVLCLGSP